MDLRNLTRHRVARLRLVFAGFVALLGLFACTMGGHIGSGSVLQQDWDKRRGPVVPHDSFPKDCSLCHAGGSWSRIREDFVFDHAKETGVPLRGAHAKAECLRCHNDRGPVQLFSQRGCAGCHEDVHRGKQGSDCQSCHGEASWKVDDALLAHNKTRFPLYGAHATVGCFRCHPGAQVGNFERTSTDCATCHQADAAATSSPNHTANGWLQGCQDCHAPVSWGPQNFNHSAWPLTGVHLTTACTACHQNNVFTAAPTQCVGCHQANYDSTSNPPHASSSIPTTCQSCHQTSGWQPASFDHAQAPANYPLTGAHTSVACVNCHTGGVYTNTPNQCVDCHLANYTSTTHPPHASSGLPQTCADCHNTSSWGGDFNHDSTGFHLSGAHRTTACANCHTNGNFNGNPVLPSDCYSCHQNDFSGTSNPPHQANGFPHTCQDCHNTNAWQPGQFNHPSTPFQLTGAHLTTSCNQCHLNGDYVTVPPTTCYGCHQPDYDGATNPNHAQLNYSTQCTLCHGTDTWISGNFDHATTGFALTGAHASPPLACTACHVGGNYNLQGHACASCHQSDYNASDNPNHTQAGFGTTCETCHTTSAWSPANTNGWSHPTTPFALTGIHTTTPCASCHTNGNYNNTPPHPTTCIGCHQSEYNSANVPPHSGGGIPTTNCLTCHASPPMDWTHATMNHTGVTGECWTCHQADYNGANSPPHASRNFPHGCALCHTGTSVWTNASTTYSWHTPLFPVSGTGHHGANVTVGCYKCHLTSQVYDTFSCITNCHSQSTTNSHHSGVGGYTYLPGNTNCYNCHPNGQSDLTGGHFGRRPTRPRPVLPPLHPTRNAPPQRRPGPATPPTTPPQPQRPPPQRP